VELTVSVSDVSAPARVDRLAPTPETPAKESVEVGVAGGSRPIYTAADRNVEPAALTRPQLPSEPSEAAGTRGQIGVLQIVVNESGSVETVRLTSSSERLNEKMLVAAGKAWRFHPARLNGVPVRYRLLVAITQ
jgi:protein TonB